MSKCIVCVLLLVSLVDLRFAEAQQAIKIPRIGFLGSLSASLADQSRVEGLRLGLRQLGYIEGENILIEYRYADGNPERLPG
jgi:putative tryptophan/tyrosine transport system substrate-binding protein